MVGEIIDRLFTKKEIKREMTLEEAVKRGWTTLELARYIDKKITEEPAFTEEQRKILIDEIVNELRLQHNHLLRWLRLRKREVELGIRFPTPITVKQLKRREEKVGLPPWKPIE